MPTPEKYIITPSQGQTVREKYDELVGLLRAGGYNARGADTQATPIAVIMQRPSSLRENNVGSLHIKRNPLTEGMDSLEWEISPDSEALASVEEIQKFREFARAHI